MPPSGSPYVTLHTADGITLQPGERLILTLQFLDARGGQAIRYTPKIFRTITTP